MPIASNSSSWARPALALAAALGALAAAARAEAACAEGKHCFLRSQYTKNRCWDVRKSSPGTSVLTTVTPTPAGSSGSPGPSVTMDGLAFIPDPQVLASPRYLLVYGASSYTFYDRATGKPLAQTECVPLSGAFTDLFAPLLLAKDKSGGSNGGDINREAPQSPIACDINDIDKCPGSCINEAYDARAHFDRDSSGSGRWWIEVAGRNQMWVDEAGGSCSSNGIQKDEARRYLFVAVSKTENPNDGFYEFVLARDYADWPLFSVNNGRLLLAHWDSKNLFVFDADKLAANTSSDPYLGMYDASTFSKPERITPVTQYSGASGASLVLGESGGNDLHVYAFIDPTKSPAHQKVTLDHKPDWYMQPILRHGKLYLAYQELADSATNRYAVTVFRVPVSVTSKSPIAIDVDKGKSRRLSNDDSSLERPGIEVETNDAVIVWYMRYGLKGSPAPQVRYNVHYDSDDDFEFRDGVTLHTGAATPTSDLHKWADIDLPGGNSDPDAVAFWISHSYSDSSGSHRQVVAQIKPGCGAETLCGTDCFDVSTDHDNCGSCGHACGSKEQCDKGACKTTTPTCSGVDLLTDPKNCGGCGRSCGALDCIQGRCCARCVCQDGFSGGVCETSGGCEHICLAHEPH